MQVIIPRRNRRRVSMPFRYTYTPDFPTWAHAPAPSVFSGDPAGNWELRIYGAGTLAVRNRADVEVFAVGPGGAAVGAPIEGAPVSNVYGMGGGGAGYTQLAAATLAPGRTYTMTVGRSGAYAADRTEMSASGTAIITAQAGMSGGASMEETHGGWGGSGGAAMFVYGTQAAVSASGGSDGANGTAYITPGGSGANYGHGQGTTTRAFGEAAGALFATGGDTAYLQSVSRQPSAWGDGGAVEYVNGGFVYHDPWPGLIIIRNARG